MKDHTVILLVILTQLFEYEAYPTTPTYFGERNFKSNKIKPKIDSNYKRTAQLIQLIDKVNKNIKLYNQKHSDDNEGKHMPKDLDYYAIREAKRDDIITKIMKLIQKNYDANRVHEIDDGIRIHFISNPEVLDEYKTILRGRETSSSSSDDSSDEEFSDRKLMKLLTALRRNAVFRIDTHMSAENELSDISNEDDVNVDVDVNLHNSIEINPDPADKRTSIDNIPTESLLDGTDNLSPIENNKKDKHYRKRDGNYKEVESENDWDIITKKYEWNIKEKHSKSKKLKNNREDNEETTKYENSKNDWNDSKRLISKTYKDLDTNKKLKKKKWGSQENWEEPVKSDKDQDWDEDRPKATTKRNKWGDNDWQSYKPKRDYYKGPPKRFELERSGPLPLFGRTPIPFVGKRGIYEDK